MSGVQQLDLLDQLEADERRRRLALHAAGDFCPACGTTEYPHGGADV